MYDDRDGDITKRQVIGADTLEAVKRATEEHERQRAADARFDHNVKKILLLLVIALVCCWLFATAGCAAYKGAWRTDGACFARCQSDLGRDWWGGSYADDSAYCICVAYRDERMWRILTPKDATESVGMLRPVFPYHIPDRMRVCRDRTAMVCGEL